MPPTVLLMGTLTNKRGQLISRVFSTAVFPNPSNPEFCVVERWRDLTFLTTEHRAEGGIVESWRRWPMSTVTVRSFRSRSRTLRREMRWVLDAQERATTERLSQWRGARSVGTPEPSASNCAARRSPGSASSAGASTRSSASPTSYPHQQLVRPLLVIVDADSPVAAGKDL